MEVSSFSAAADTGRGFSEQLTLSAFATSAANSEPIDLKKANPLINDN
jgi:hypothetical protein